MANQHTADSSPVSEPAPNLSKRSRRSRAMRTAQDEVPYHATERRDPRRMLRALRTPKPAPESPTTIEPRTSCCSTFGKRLPWLISS